MINILLSIRNFNNKEIYEAVKPYINEESKICVLTYSFFSMFFPDRKAYDSYYQKGGKYYDKILNSLSIFDIKESNFIWVDYYRDSTANALEKIAQADVIYLPGGAPDEMMNRIIEKGLVEALSDKNKTYIGVSAGTMIQFGKYYISPDQEYATFSEQNGLNLVSDFYVEVHYRRRKKQKSSIRKVWRKYHKNMFVIPNDGCIIVNNGEVETISTAKQLYDKKGIIR